MLVTVTFCSKHAELCARSNTAEWFTAEIIANSVISFGLLVTMFLALWKHPHTDFHMHTYAHAHIHTHCYIHTPHTHAREHTQMYAHTNTHMHTNIPPPPTHTHTYTGLSFRTSSMSEMVTCSFPSPLRGFFLEKMTFNISNSKLLYHINQNVTHYQK